MTDQPATDSEEKLNSPTTYAQLRWVYNQIKEQNDAIISALGVIQAHLSDHDLQLDRIINNQADIYTKLHEIEDRLNPPAVTPPAPKPAAQPKPAARPTPLASGPVVNNGRNLGLLNGKPKATETQPYDVYQVIVDDYAFDGAEVRFYRTGMQYPEASMRLNEKTEGLFREVFGDWQPHQTETGKHLPVVSGRQVVLTVQCTGPDRVTRKGNPYHNIVKAESVEA